MRRRMMASLCGWKNPYVTDGLIAMFDAFANTSTGSHTTNPNKLGLVVGGGAGGEHQSVGVGVGGIEHLKRRQLDALAVACMEG